jgi:hypothetical protein
VCFTAIYLVAPAFAGTTKKGSSGIQRLVEVGEDVLLVFQPD